MQMKKQHLIIIAVAIIVSCNNKKQETEENMTGYTEDSTSGKFVPGPDPGKIAYGKPSGSLNVDEDELEERKKRRDLLYMGIDSTYFAIHQIEEIKNEIGDEPSIDLTVSERNIKSKAIQKLNVLQNSLAMQVDSALLVNLKIHTKQLSDINNSITGNVMHLKDISAKLTKAANVMTRITGVLSFCVSKGLIKPPTPPGSTAAAVKSAVK
jgi:hypothetical protein